MDIQQRLPVAYGPAKILPRSNSNGPGTRRVTGSADIPLTPKGNKQAGGMADKLSHEFDYVFCSPEQRSIDTAEKFGKPIILNGLDAWYRGSFEGHSAEKTKPAMKSLILHPTMKPPGKSPISGKPGEPYAEFLKDLTHVARTAKEQWRPGTRELFVTSGGNLEAINVLASSGFPKDPTPGEYKKLSANPYLSMVGQLFMETPDGLKKVSDNKEPARYWLEHGETQFNNAPSKS